MVAKLTPAPDNQHLNTGWNIPPLSDGLALYIHFPFCKSKCRYCDFNTYEGIEALRAPYLSALKAEISLWGQALDNPYVNSVFLGGGTPSYMSSTEISLVLDTCRNSFVVRNDAEITIEANPDDCTKENSAAWAQAGVNRVSMGIQSFDDGLLAALGRRHDSEKARSAIQIVAAEFANFSLDLMFGLPYQTLEQWSSTLNVALAHKPSHLSLYGLQLEQGTPMERDARTGAIPVPDDDLAADQYLVAEERLHKFGFTRYEVSNWAVVGAISKHNLAYWRNRPYLGVGAGAHSSLCGMRFANVRSPRAYSFRVTGHIPQLQTSTGQAAHTAIPEFIRHAQFIDTPEHTTRPMAMGETMMLGLRLSEGVNNEQFHHLFGVNIEEPFATQLASLTEAGLVTWDGSRVALAENTWLVANEVFQRFMLAE